MIGIIGGTGFLGLNLAWHLQQSAVPCRTFSRNGLLLSPQSSYYRRLSEIEHVTGDFSNEAAVRDFVAPCHSIVVVVSHLLPASSPQEIQTVISWFGAAFIQLLESCRNSDIDQIVFVSSGGTIYGENFDGVPVNEQYPLNPHCAYGSFCAFLEQLIRTFHNQHGMAYTILRVGNPYGLLKRTDKNQGIIDHYIRAARAGTPFTIFGDGGEIRDYIYVDDISRLMTRVLDPSSESDTFNIGTGLGHTSNEVISLVKEHFDLPDVPILTRSRRLGDVSCSVLNMDKFERTYGTRCNISLEKGLQRYAELEIKGV